MIFVFLFAIMVLGECPEPLPNTFALPLARRTSEGATLCEFIDLNHDSHPDYVCSWWTELIWLSDGQFSPSVAQSCFYENGYVQWILKK